MMRTLKGDNRTDCIKGRLHHPVFPVYNPLSSRRRAGALVDDASSQTVNCFFFIYYYLILKKKSFKYDYIVELKEKIVLLLQRNDK